jgi:two-component system, NarL family, sensor histidine kinase DevS
MPAEQARSSARERTSDRVHQTVRKTLPADGLLDLQVRLTETAKGRDRLQGLLDAVVAVGAGLEMEGTLNRIVRIAVDLVDARYGAFGVVGPDEQELLSEFVYVGVENPRHSDGTLVGGLIDHPHREQPVDRLLRDTLEAPIRVRGEVFGTLYLTEKRGAAEFSDDDGTVLKGLAAAAGFAVENARLFEESLLRERFMAASREVNTHLLGGGSSEDALTLIANRACELSRADNAVLLLAEGVPPNRVVIRAAAGEGGAEMVGIRVSTSDPLVASMFEMRGAELIPNLSALVPADWHAPGADFGPAVAVPLRAGNVVSGVLLAMRTTGGARFVGEHVPLLASFADQAALALELSEKHRAQRQLDVLADRDRIAGDLHDHVIQRLFATGMSLQGTVRRIPDPTVRRRVSRAVEQLDETVREIRTSIFDLHTTGSDNTTSLRRKMLDIVEELSTDSDVTPSVRISGAVDTVVPDSLATHATAVLREAVSNAIRHAHAGAIVVTVEAGADLIIDVVDDGVGIPRGVARSGLLGVERRAGKCGGMAAIVPGPEGGTRLTWRAPVPTD